MQLTTQQISPPVVNLDPCRDACLAGLGHQYKWMHVLSIFMLNTYSYYMYCKFAKCLGCLVIDCQAKTGQNMNSPILGLIVS